MDWITDPQIWISLVTQTVEGTHQHVNKGCIYFAMAFSLAVELRASQP